MDVLILSAGKGQRLGPLTKNTPKALLDLGNGETLIENQLGAIGGCAGVERVFVVGGYRVEQIEAKLAHWRGVPVEVVYNPFFDDTNNLISLWLGLLAIPSEGVVTVNGDDLFQASVLQTVLDAPGSHEICMVIDRPSRPMNDDDMKVVTDGDVVRRVSKEIPLEEANGQSIGMIRYRAKGLRRFRGVLHELVRSKKSFDWFYLAAVQHVIDQGFPVHWIECGESDWAEVDFRSDVQELRQLIRTERFLHAKPALARR